MKAKKPLPRKNKQSDTFVVIPKGTFVMGSPKDEPGHNAIERRKKIVITEPFSISRTLVTQNQWQSIMGTKPWQEHGPLPKDQCGRDFPAVWVSCEEAIAYCKRLSKHDHASGLLIRSEVYRLPSEAEWEYACRAGTATAYSFGGDSRKLEDYAWYAANSHGRLHEVAKKRPNEWGLFDMHGNVLEWCLDLIKKGKLSLRVTRGGHARSDCTDCRSAARHPLQWSRSEGVGFRVVRASI